MSRTSKEKAIVCSSFGAELPLITLTLWLQSAGVAILIARVRRALEGDMRQIGTLRSAALIVRVRFQSGARSETWVQSMGSLFSFMLLI
jgi:hypothetical protein